MVISWIWRGHLYGHCLVVEGHFGSWRLLTSLAELDAADHAGKARRRGDVRDRSRPLTRQSVGR